MGLFHAIVVVQLPALRPVTAIDTSKLRPEDRTRPHPQFPQDVQPRYVSVYPHGDPKQLHRDLLRWCFPDLDVLLRSPYRYEPTVDEYVFTLTQVVAPHRLHGFCRRYRVGTDALHGRTDLPPYTNSDRSEAEAAPSYECICILSDKPYHKFFSQCLQLLHTARLVSPVAASRLSRHLLSYNTAPAGSFIPMRELLRTPGMPGFLLFPKERLQVPKDIGLPYSDIPLSPLLSRLDVSALLMLYTSLLSERRIIMVSSNQSTLTSCAHAAIALIQPFVWSNVFIPSLPASLIDYAASPTPFILGLTPRLYKLLLEMYSSALGKIVLVALDEGYCAVLNDAGVPDFEGPTAANNYTGELKYSGPKLTQTAVLQRFRNSHTSSNMNQDMLAEKHDPGLDGDLMNAPYGRRTGSSGFLEGFSTSAFLVNQATMTIGRRSGATGLAEKAALIARLPNTPSFGSNSYPSVSSSSRSNSSPGLANAPMTPQRPLTPSRRNKTSGSFSSASSQTSGSFCPADYVNVPTSVIAEGLSPFHAHDRTHAYDDSAILARTARKIYTAKRTVARIAARRQVEELYAPEDYVPGIVDPLDMETDLEDSEEHRALELDGIADEESGTVTLHEDIVELVMNGEDPSALFSDSGRESRSSTQSLGRREGRRMLGKLSAMFGTGLSAFSGSTHTHGCPAYKLYTEIRAIYNSERKNGAFDEPRMLAVLLAFVTVVFGSAHKYVSVLPEDIEKEQALRRGEKLKRPIQPELDRDGFVDSFSHFPTVKKLLDAMHGTNLLTDFACNRWLTVIHRTGEFHAATRAGVPPPKITPSIVDIAFGALESYNKSDRTLSTPIQQPQTPPTSLTERFTHVKLQVHPHIASAIQSVLDIPTGHGSLGVAGTNHTVASALTSLEYASKCAAAGAADYVQPPKNGLPPASLPVIVTALRGLLSAATSVDQLPVTSPGTISRVVAAATFDPHLIHVVMGVLWARLNDCLGKYWVHGFRALDILLVCLRYGSPRVPTLAISFLPLLRFLIHPVRTNAVRAGRFTEALAGQSASTLYIQVANVMNRIERVALNQNIPAPVPGLELTRDSTLVRSLSPRQGVLLIARLASRVYSLIVNPKEWVTERIACLGPKTLTNALPIPQPAPYPFVSMWNVASPGYAALPHGWFPSRETNLTPIPPSTRELQSQRVQHKPSLATEASFSALHRTAKPLFCSSDCPVLIRYASSLHVHSDDIILRSNPDNPDDAVHAQVASTAKISPVLHATATSPIMDTPSLSPKQDILSTDRNIEGANDTFTTAPSDDNLPVDRPVSFTSLREAMRANTISIIPPIDTEAQAPARRRQVSIAMRQSSRSYGLSQDGTTSSGPISRPISRTVSSKSYDRSSLDMIFSPLFGADNKNDTNVGDSDETATTAATTVPMDIPRTSTRGIADTSPATPPPSSPDTTSPVALRTPLKEFIARASSVPSPEPHVQAQEQTQPVDEHIPTSAGRSDSISVSTGEDQTSPSKTLTTPSLRDSPLSASPNSAVTTPISVAATTPSYRTPDLFAGARRKSIQGQEVRELSSLLRASHSPSVSFDFSSIPTDNTATQGTTETMEKMKELSLSDVTSDHTNVTPISNSTSATQSVYSAENLASDTTTSTNCEKDPTLSSHSYVPSKDPSYRPHLLDVFTPLQQAAVTQEETPTDTAQEMPIPDTLDSLGMVDTLPHSSSVDPNAVSSPQPPKHHYSESTEHSIVEDTAEQNEDTGSVTDSITDTEEPIQGMVTDDPSPSMGLPSPDRPQDTMGSGDRIPVTQTEVDIVETMDGSSVIVTDEQPSVMIEPSASEDDASPIEPVEKNTPGDDAMENIGGTAVDCGTVMTDKNLLEKEAYLADPFANAIADPFAETCPNAQALGAMDVEELDVEPTDVSVTLAESEVQQPTGLGTEASNATSTSTMDPFESVIPGVQDANVQKGAEVLAMEQKESNASSIREVEVDPEEDTGEVNGRDERGMDETAKEEKDHVSHHSSTISSILPERVDIPSTVLPSDGKIERVISGLTISSIPSVSSISSIPSMIPSTPPSVVTFGEEHPHTRGPGISGAGALPELPPGTPEQRVHDPLYFVPTSVTDSIDAVNHSHNPGETSPARPEVTRKPSLHELTIGSDVSSSLDASAVLDRVQDRNEPARPMDTDVGTDHDSEPAPEDSQTPTDPFGFTSAAFAGLSLRRKSQDLLSDIFGRRRRSSAMSATSPSSPPSPKGTKQVFYTEHTNADATDPKPSVDMMTSPSSNTPHLPQLSSGIESTRNVGGRRKRGSLVKLRQLWNAAAEAISPERPKSHETPTRLHTSLDAFINSPSTPNNVNNATIVQKDSPIPTRTEQQHPNLEYFSPAVDTKTNPGPLVPESPVVFDTTAADVRKEMPISQEITADGVYGQHVGSSPPIPPRKLPQAPPVLSLDTFKFPEPSESGESKAPPFTAEQSKSRTADPWNPFNAEVEENDPSATTARIGGSVFNPFDD